MDCTTEQLRARWTVQAYNEIWLPSPLVIGVTPYALLDQPQGFPWMTDVAGQYKFLPVYEQVRDLLVYLAGSSQVPIPRTSDGD